MDPTTAEPAPKKAKRDSKPVAKVHPMVREEEGVNFILDAPTENANARDQQMETQEEGTPAENGNARDRRVETQEQLQLLVHEVEEAGLLIHDSGAAVDPHSHDHLRPNTLPPET